MKIVIIRAYFPRYPDGSSEFDIFYLSIPQPLVNFPAGNGKQKCYLCGLEKVSFWYEIRHNHAYVLTIFGFKIQAL
jgi:hypothetical protein